MAEPAEEQKGGEPAPLGALTTEIVAAYVTKNAVAIAVLGHAIETVGRALAALAEEPKPDTAEPKPAVPVRRSIRQDQLVCLVCGKRLQTLRRHLDRAHQLTPETYRERFGLKPDYPMLAPDYARQRSEAAKRVGLGQRVQPGPEPGTPTAARDPSVGRRIPSPASCDPHLRLSAGSPRPTTYARCCPPLASSTRFPPLP